MKGTLQYKNEVWDFDISESTSCDALIKLVHDKTKLNTQRIRIFYYDENSGKKLYIENSNYIRDIKSTKFFVKDLGPQIGYRTVFILEYLGPFLMFPLMLFLLKVKDISSNVYLKYAVIMWEFHYTKRILESIFVHKFSRSTMPMKNLYKNCAYYWTFALLITKTIISRSEHASEFSTLQKAGIIIFCVSEMLNFYCHLKLRFLRPKNSTKHLLPKGFLFNHIVCPNYTSEICTWIGFSMYSLVIPAVLFLFAGATQMFIWAKEKKSKLVKEFPEAKKRALLIPFIL